MEIVKLVFWLGAYTIKFLKNLKGQNTLKPYMSVFFVLVLFLASCQTIQPTPTLVPTSTPTLPPTPTNTPEPTFTAEPSPTPIRLPDAINQTFSGISIEQRNSFEYIKDGLIPEGWICEEEFAARATKDNQFKIQPADKGDWSATVFYFSKEKITPGTAVYFTFMYTGDKEAFTLGFDALQGNGQLIKNGEKGFYSVAMQVMEKNLSAHIIQDTFKGEGYFKGDLKLRENTWYDIVLGFDNEENYIIKLWQPDDPETQLTYVRNWKDFPTNYYFIGWVSAKRSLLIDDFTVFKFDSIILE